MITNLAFTLRQSEGTECCSKQSVFSRCIIPTMDVCLCACTCVWLCVFFQHCALQLCPCFIHRNKQPSKWSDRCRRISMPPPWTQYRVNSHWMTSHTQATVHKEAASSLHTRPAALENFSSSSLFIKLILIMKRFLFEVGVFSKPWWPILPTHSVYEVRQGPAGELPVFNEH